VIIFIHGRIENDMREKWMGHPEFLTDKV